MDRLISLGANDLANVIELINEAELALVPISFTTVGFTNSLKTAENM